MKTFKIENGRVGGTHPADRTPDLVNCFSRCIARLEAQGRFGSATNYRMACRRLVCYTGGTVHLSDITRAWVREYESWLRSGGLCHNSVSFHLRYVRAVYNAAAAEANCEPFANPFTNPFAHVRTTPAATGKRAIRAADMQRIRDCELSAADWRKALARDMFLFSFYARGMSFVDMVYLRKSDVRDGVLTYSRRKTGQVLSMSVEPPLERLIARYDNPSPYVLPLLAGDDSYRAYRVQQRRMNRSISALGRELGFEVPLTFYVARHTWATLARDTGAPIQFISEGMGHTSERTTRIYLRQLDRGRIDELNRCVIASVTAG